MTMQTVMSQVHAIIMERFANCEPFTYEDIANAAPWLEEYHDPRQGLTTRISACLSWLRRSKAIEFYDQRGRVYRYIIEPDMIRSYQPSDRNSSIGYRKEEKRS